MESKYCYTKIIILGSGKLGFQCAMESRKYLSDVQVLEYKVTDSTVLQKLCEKEEISYRFCEKQELFEILQGEQERTLLVSASNTYLIPKTIIGKDNLTIINWHNALLPEHKGRNAESWCIYEGDAVTGITWHMLTADVDAGDVLWQKEIPIEETTTALKLFQKQCDLGAESFGEILEELLLERCKGQPQKTMEQEQMHYSYEIPNGGYLDTDWDFARMSCFLRAMDYGALQLMGEMKVGFQGRTYRFHKYKIKECPDSLAEVFLQEKDLIIYRQGHEITLRNVSLSEE